MTPYKPEMLPRYAVAPDGKKKYSGNNDQYHLVYGHLLDLYRVTIPYAAIFQNSSRLSYSNWISTSTSKRKMSLRRSTKLTSYTIALHCSPRISHPRFPHIPAIVPTSSSKIITLLIQKKNMLVCGFQYAEVAYKKFPSAGLSMVYQGMWISHSVPNFQWSDSKRSMKWLIQEKNLNWFAIASDSTICEEHAVRETMKERELSGKEKRI